MAAEVRYDKKDKMAFFQFSSTQKIPASLGEVWHFISAPDNLRDITPPYMQFTVTSKTGGDHMYAGMIITYKVSPLLRIPMRWMTEITHMRENEYFVDEQRVGPYRLWHHQHKITAVEGGVEMTDIVTYAPPFGPIGKIANALFIKRQLREIFEFRRSAIERRFGTVKIQPS